MTTYKQILSGELGNEGGNTEVLKDLFCITPQIETADDILNSIDTKIKGEFFNK